MKILLHSGPGWVSGAIKWQTDSAWNHASVLFDCGRLIEAREGKGVVETPLDDVRRAMAREPRLIVQAFDLPPISAAAEEEALAFAVAQKGKGYDWWAIARFVTRGQTGPREGKWFCSELAFAVAAKAGVNLLERIPAWRVDPGRLSTSPLLRHSHYLRPLYFA